MSYDNDHNAGIDLSDVTGCKLELQRVSNAVAELTQEKVALLVELEDLEEKWELIHAAAFNAVTAEKGATAKQINSLALEAISRNEKTAQLRKDVRLVRAKIENLSQRLDALDARGRLAGSAVKAGEQEARYAGYGGG
jgi:chromosome segregation ATPase